MATAMVMVMKKGPSSRTRNTTNGERHNFGCDYAGSDQDVLVPQSSALFANSSESEMGEISFG